MTKRGIQKKDILIIDDDEFILEILSATLQFSNGFNVSNSQTGLEGFASAKENPPHLILLDYMLPDISGLELITRFKSEEATCDIPIIILSGLDDPQFQRQAIQAGAAMFLTKPIHASYLCARIDELISK